MDPGHDTTGGHTAMLSERARLVRLCAHLTGDMDATEDLAQEALYEALRNEHKLHDTSGYSRWLAAIARNVCLRWARRRARESARLVRLLSDEMTPLDLDWWATRDFDLEVELERDELAELLDRAMALLPSTTRDVLTGEYIDGTPRADIAAMLGLSEAAVEKRLQRGRLALRRVLATELSPQAAPYGLDSAHTEEWQETRVWCPFCGNHRLTARFTKPRAELTFRCPACSLGPHDNIAHLYSAELLAGVKAFKPALTRILLTSRDYYTPTLIRREAACPSCRRSLQLKRGLGHSTPRFLRDHPAVHVCCPACGDRRDTTLAHLLLTLPEGRSFWREHPRMRVLLPREVETDGQPALVSRLESISDRAVLEVVTRRDTWQPMGIHRVLGA